MKKVVTFFKTNTSTHFRIKYQFCQSNIEQLRNLFHSYKQQADSTQIISQIKSLNIEQLNINQQKAVAKIFFETANYQEDIATKIFDTAVQGYFQEKQPLNDTLEILSTITSPLNSEELNDNLMKFLVTVIQSPCLEAESFAYAILTYGKLLKIQFEKSGLLELELLRHAEYVNGFTSKSLSTLAQGIMLAQLNEKAIIKLLETHSLKTEMELDDLIRIALALMKCEQISENFFQFFAEQLEKNVSQIKPAQILLLISIAKIGNFFPGFVWNTLDNAFLNVYNDMPFHERLLIFSELASLQYKSPTLWKKFEEEYNEIQKNINPKQSLELIYQCLNIFEMLSQDIQQKMFIFIAENVQHIEINYRDAFLKRAVDRGILTEEEAKL